MTSLVLLLVALLLVITLFIVRSALERQQKLERDNEAMQSELARHRETVHSILRELQNP